MVISTPASGAGPLFTVEARCKAAGPCRMEGDDLWIQIGIRNTGARELGFPFAFLKRRGPSIKLTDTRTQASTQLRTLPPPAELKDRLTAIPAGQVVTMDWVLHASELEQWGASVDVSALVEVSADVLVDGKKLGARGQATFRIVVEDPITTLVDILSALGDGGLWTNGISPNLELPANATDEEVVAQYFQRVSFDSGKATFVHLVRARKVTIGDGHYTAALVDTNLGQKVLVLRRERTSWWTKLFAADHLDGFVFSGLMTTGLSEDDPVARSWGPQRDYFKKNAFRVIDWNAATVILAHYRLAGGKQYHSGWLALRCADGTQYLTKQPALDAYRTLAESRGVVLDGFASE